MGATGIAAVMMFAMIGSYSGFAADFLLPSGAVADAGEAPQGDSWQQYGTIELTYAAAKKNFDLALRKQGWVKRKNIDYDRVHWKSLEVWSKGDELILLHFWREDIALTGFAWGTLEEDETE